MFDKKQGRTSKPVTNDGLRGRLCFSVCSRRLQLNGMTARSSQRSVGRYLLAVNHRGDVRMQVCAD